MQITTKILDKVQAIHMEDQCSVSSCTEKSTNVYLYYAKDKSYFAVYTYCRKCGKEKEDTDYGDYAFIKLSTKEIFYIKCK